MCVNRPAGMTGVRVHNSEGKVRACFCSGAHLRVHALIFEWVPACEEVRVRVAAILATCLSHMELATGAVVDFQIHI